MYKELRKAYFRGKDKTAYISDLDGQTLYFYCTEKSTGLKLSYENEYQTVWTLDENGMPDNLYMALDELEDFEKFEISRDLIPWPKEVKEPK